MRKTHLRKQNPWQPIPFGYRASSKQFIVQPTILTLMELQCPYLARKSRMPKLRNTAHNIFRISKFWLSCSFLIGKNVNSKFTSYIFVLCFLENLGGVGIGLEIFFHSFLLGDHFLGMHCGENPCFPSITGHFSQSHLWCFSTFRQAAETLCCRSVLWHPRQVFGQNPE